MAVNKSIHLCMASGVSRVGTAFSGAPELACGKLGV